MSGQVHGKIALITGAARGQGRSHAIRLAEEGADIIAFDLCAQIDSVRYPLASPEDLAETEAAVTALGRRVVTAIVDVRDRSALREAVDKAVVELGGSLDIVCANAGILPTKDREATAFIDAIDVDFGGVLNTVAAAFPHLSDGSSVILTGSTGGLIPGAVQNPVLGPGGVGYALAKKFVVEYTEALALQVGARGIRVNAVHPTNVDTHLVHEVDVYKAFRSDLDSPQREDILDGYTDMHAIPVPWVEPVDVSNAVVFLASEASRYVTGMQLRVDAGALLKAGVFTS